MEGFFSNRQQGGKPYHRDDAPGGRRSALRGECRGRPWVCLQAGATRGRGIHGSPLSEGTLCLVTLLFLC